MTPMIVRGVPRSLQKDAWWMAADSQTGVGRSEAVTPRPWWILVLLVAVVDVLALRTALGLGFVIAILSVGAATHWALRETVSTRRALVAWAVLGVSVIPAIDLVQFLSFVISIAGLLFFAGILSGPRWVRAAIRIPFWGAAQSLRDVRAAELRGPSKSLVLDWLLSVGIGAVFLMLLVFANPLVETWFTQFNYDNVPSFDRAIMWVIVAALIWPMLRLAQMNLHKQLATAPIKHTSVAYVNKRSVLRALIVFNVIFAVQSLLDIGYLWGGVRLPDGMNYATYAHRGAYPLMVTALLAGGFALVAQPWLDGRFMRGLFLVWVAQTVLLVVSSILRLDLYVGVYGMTHLRFAAFVWMSVVALGLIVLVIQIVQRQSTRWMLIRAFGIGAFAVYICSLVNVTGYVARHHLTVGPLDEYYVCSLDGAAMVEIARHADGMCDVFAQHLDAPQGLRDWGFRNARLRRSLALTKSEPNL